MRHLKTGAIILLERFPETCESTADSASLGHSHKSLLAMRAVKESHLCCGK